MRIYDRVPTDIDSTDRFMFYLHGLIVENMGIRPWNKKHGYYEYELILSSLADLGYVVISEVREKGTDIRYYAELVASQVRALLQAGVPPANITIVGASRGGVIGAYVSSILKESKLNYVILAGLFEKYLSDNSLKLYGRVLSIHDESDQYSITPNEYFLRSKGLGEYQAVTLHIGKGHGILFQPYKEWVVLLDEWAKHNQADAGDS